ncbi:MAG: helix-turn-helix transcriptional regulator [Finegoldia magna]|uniref:helix-turn-helix domain-containing protein n=1 Tax=Finegoldia magna TaxID=1260 RepID=UPI000B91C6D8|nr:helix-turn-helix transcriptional regulator [Finegoldia magna]MDU2131067.1 helix-turn-helix transcriptional regulator [Finegoldia magna]OXZ36048.1 hypothetical protein B9N53_00320 [Finegoldia magna]
MLNENIKRIREEKGMTQKQLADKVGISGAFMSLIEKGTNNPSEENLQKIANALDVPIEILLAAKNKTPEIELIEILIQLTKSNKIIWSIAQHGDEYYGPDPVKYVSIVNDTRYLIIHADVIPLRLQNGLYYSNLKSDKIESVVRWGVSDEFKEISEKLTELWNAIELSVNGKSFIYDQIDELKKLLDEDKNANI